MLLPRLLLLSRVLLLSRGLLLLLAGLAGALAWLALPRALLLLLLVLLAGAVLLVRLLRHFLHSFRLVISKPGWLAVGAWSPSHGKPFCRRTWRNAEFCEFTAIT